jgi:putative transposase
MPSFVAMLNVMRALLLGLLSVLRSRRHNALYIAALEQQLGVLRREKVRPTLSVFDRAFWIGLCRHWAAWRSALAIVQPETVLRWHRAGYRLFWRWRSQAGRPRIPKEHAELIRSISRQHPELGEDQIALELETKLGVRHSPSTVRRYRWRAPKPPGPPRHPSQSWRTFLTNHAGAIWACDFVVQATARFIPVYIFVVIELRSRQVVWINATPNPSLDWVKAQIRQAAPFDSGPKFLIHDNDGIFGQFRKSKRPFRCELDRWLKHAMGMRGIPTPYGAPNANAHVKRFNRTLREQLLRHFIFVNPRHLVRLLRRYTEYYNRARPSQAIGKIPDPYPELRATPPSTGKVVALPVLGGLHHDYRRAA